VGHGDGSDQIYRRLTKDADLSVVIAFGFAFGHQGIGMVTIASRPDTAANDDRAVRSLKLIAHVDQQANRGSIRLRQGLWRITDFLSPIRVRTPRRTFENESDALGPGQATVGLKIVAQGLLAVFSSEQNESRQVGQVKTLLKDQARFNSTICDE
jgi:hypothetical protein